MKKIKTMAVALLAVVGLPMLLASCDSNPYYDDEWYQDYTWGDNYNNRPANDDVSDDDFFIQMAQTIKGQWRGEMTAYQLDENKVAIDSISYQTDIEFKPYSNTSITGTGTQYDYDALTGEQIYKRDFSWYIETSTGNVYLTYKEPNGNGTTSDYVMRINYDDLHLNDRSFTGFLWAVDGHEVEDFGFDRYYASQAKAAPGTRAGRNVKVKSIRFVMK